VHEKGQPNNPEFHEPADVINHIGIPTNNQTNKHDVLSLLGNRESTAKQSLSVYTRRMQAGCPKIRRTPVYHFADVCTNTHRLDRDPDRDLAVRFKPRTGLNDLKLNGSVRFRPQIAPTKSFTDRGLNGAVRFCHL
jgi:hypothetical protein